MKTGGVRTYLFIFSFTPEGCPLFVLSKGEKRTGQGGEVLSTIPKGEIVEQGDHMLVL